MSDDLSIPNPGYRGSRAGRYGTGRIRVRQGMNPDTRRLMIFAGALGAVLMVLIGVSALMGHHTGEVPVVTADTRPIREKPANPGGMKIDGAENDLFSGGTDTGNAKLAPAPESPDTKGLRASAPTQTASADAPAPVPSSSVASSPVASAASTSGQTTPPAMTRTAAAPVALAPVTKQAAVASLPVKRAPSSTPAKPMTEEATHPAQAAEAAHPAPQNPTLPGHPPMVQLGALASEEAARAEWAQLVKKLPDLLNGKQPNYSRIERDGHSFWRVRTSGFADVAQARGFCDHVRAKGGGCSVADF